MLPSNTSVSLPPCRTPMSDDTDDGMPQGIVNHQLVVFIEIEVWKSSDGKKNTGLRIIVYSYMNACAIWKGT